MNAKLLIRRDRVILHAPDGLTKLQTHNRNAIAGILSYRRDDYFFSEAYQTGRWSGVTELYRKKRAPKGTFPVFPGDGDWFQTGLLPRSVAAWARLFDIEDQRDVPVITIDESKPSFQGLRPYQQEAVRALFSFRAGDFPMPRGIIHLPPRSGKTRIAAAVIDQIPDRPVVFVVERIDLARQTVAALTEQLDEPIGLVADGVADIQEVTVITIQSLHLAFNIKYDKKDKYEHIEKVIAKRKPVADMVSNCAVFVLDEGHHASNPSYRKAIMKARNAWCVLGLSGTPWMDDGSDLLLESVIGPIIYHRSHSYMVKNGYLVPLDIYFYKLPELYCYSGHYTAVYKAAVVENPIKEHIILEATRSLLRAGKSVAILVTQIAHAKRLTSLIPGAVMLTGKERGAYRHEVYKKLDQKRIKCIVSTVFSEGIDVPSLDAAINADGGKDSRRVFQRLRMQTPSPGKLRGIYIDFIHQEEHLRKHSKRRLEFYESEDCFNVIIRDYEDYYRMKFSGQVPLA